LLSESGIAPSSSRASIITGLVLLQPMCSLSLWRVVRGIKLTYLASRIHGLFIT
jgi:hypothetical protein